MASLSWSAPLETTYGQDKYRLHDRPPGDAGTAHVEYGEHAADVGLDRLFGDDEKFGDLTPGSDEESGPRYAWSVGEHRSASIVVWATLRGTGGGASRSWGGPVYEPPPADSASAQRTREQAVPASDAVDVWRLKRLRRVTGAGSLRAEPEALV
jgi:hypothetical protein